MGFTYYYVDSENVHNNLDALLRALKRYDRVVWCYSVASPSIKCEYLEEFARKRVKVIYLNCQVGSPNAMDFQIVMQMAHDYATGEASAVRVYSNDHGFVIPVKAWADRGYNFGVLCPDIIMPVSQQPTKKAQTAQIVVLESAKAVIEESVAVAPAVVQQVHNASSLKAAIAKCAAPKDVEKIFNALRQCKGKKNRFHSNLQLAYSDELERATALYHATKHLIPRYLEANIEGTQVGGTLYDDVLNIVGKANADVIYGFIRASGGDITCYNTKVFQHFKPAPGNKTISNIVSITKHLVSRWREK